MGELYLAADVGLGRQTANDEGDKLEQARESRDGVRGDVPAPV